MVGFVLGVTLVFNLIEEVGYMARISYAFDGTMARLGLQGKSIMPCFVSVGCTIGGASGVIDSWGKRMLTITLAWAVTSTLQETHSVKWTLRIAAYYFVFALALCFVVYRIGLLIF